MRRAPEREPPEPGDRHRGRRIRLRRRKSSPSARRLAPGGGSHQEVLIRIWKRCRIGNSVTGRVTLCDSQSHLCSDFEVLIFGKRWQWQDGYRLQTIFAATSKYQSSENACTLRRRPQNHLRATSKYQSSENAYSTRRPQDPPSRHTPCTFDLSL